jgi:hypothetical protein
MRAPRGVQAVLVLDPAGCVSCNVPLSEWLVLRRAYPSRVKFLFTRRPTNAELRPLTVARIPIDSVLSADEQPIRGNRWFVGEYLFTGGKLVSFDTGRTAYHSLRVTTAFRRETLHAPR